MKISKLSLRFVNNIERQIELFEHKTVEIIEKENSNYITYKYGEKSMNLRNFYEFYVDNQSLINIISKCYWNFEANEKSLFFNTHIGCLGGFSLFWDRIYVSVLTDKKFSQNQIEKLVKLFKPNYKNSGSCITNQKINNQIINVVRDQFLMYCCQDCGDYGCGGITMKIMKKDEVITWTDNKKIEIHFNKVQYEKVFREFIKMRELAIVSN